MPLKHLSDLGPDGTTFGQTTADKISFYGVTPIAQRAGATQVVIANAAAGTFGFNSAAEKTAWFDLITEIRATLVAIGGFKGAA